MSPLLCSKMALKRTSLSSQVTKIDEIVRVLKNQTLLVCSDCAKETETVEFYVLQAKILALDEVYEIAIQQRFLKDRDSYFSSTVQAGSLKLTFVLAIQLFIPVFANSDLGITADTWTCHAFDC